MNALDAGAFLDRSPATAASSALMRAFGARRENLKTLTKSQSQMHSGMLVVGQFEVIAHISQQASR